MAGGSTREEILEKKRQYRIENKDKIKAYTEMRKEKVNCECGGSYTLNNKHHHIKTKKHQQDLANRQKHQQTSMKS